MTTKIVYHAELDHRNFKAGVDSVERDTARLISGADRARLAFRHFERGNIGDGFRNIGMAAEHAGARLRSLGSTAFETGRRISGALEGGISILQKYVLLGGIVSGVLGGMAAKLTILDSAKLESTIGRAAIGSGATPAQRKAMLQHAMDIGVETPFGPQAVADSMMVEAQRGRNPDEILALTEATKKFAVVANIDMAHAAETLSQVMFQFDIPMKDATKTALQLANAAVATSMGGEEMFNALKFAGGAAGLYKVELTELLAVLGTLRQVTDTSVASTSVRNIILAASALKEKSPKKLEALGMDEEVANRFTFMSGEAKGLVDVITQLNKFFEKEPELKMKAGFGTRTLVTMDQIAKKAGDSGKFFGELVAKIEDTARAEEQFAEILNLADNRFRRLETTAGAVLTAIGSKIRETFGIDDQADALGDRLAEISKTIAAIPKENVSEIVDTLGAGMIQAFGTAIAFLVRAMGPVALAFGDVLFQGIKAAASSLLDSDEYKSYKAQYAQMSPEQRAAESERLIGAKTITEDDVRESMIRRPGNAKRIEAMFEVQQGGAGVDKTLRTAMKGVQWAISESMNDLRSNPTVLATKKAMEAGAAARKDQAWSDALAGAQGGKAGEGFVNAGVMNVYGAFSGSARARPARPSGSTPAERAQR